MMTYADLSGAQKGSGGASSFKGPALKDVKVEKSLGPAYKPSQKSRDWSTLSQNLEDAFVISSPSSSISGPSSNVTNVSFQQTSPVFPPHSSIPQISERSEGEWGDFQDFGKSNTLVQNPPPTSFPHSVQSLGNLGLATNTVNHPFTSPKQSLPPLSQPTSSLNNVDDDDDDDFADFVAAAPNSNISSSVSSTSIPAVGFAFPSQNIPPLQASNLSQNSSNTQQSNEIAPSNAIGSRLATFQEESPIHRFKNVVSPNLSGFTAISESSDPKNNNDTKHDDGNDDDDDFGDFASSRNVITSSNLNAFPAATVFPSPVTNTSINPFTGSTTQESLLSDNNFTASFTSIPALQPTQNSDDKYSAFRDAFDAETSGTFCDTQEISNKPNLIIGAGDETTSGIKSPTLDLLSDNMTTTIQAPPNEIKANTNIAFPPPIISSSFSENSKLPSSLGDFLSSPIIPSPIEEDDFGDFIAVREDKQSEDKKIPNQLSDLENMNSIPSPKRSEAQHVRSDNFFMPQHAGIGNSLNSSATVMPVWHDSEPPPLMDDHANIPGMDKEQVSGVLTDDFFQGFDDHDVSSTVEHVDDLGCTSILDEDQYFEAPTSNETTSQKNPSPDQQTPTSLDVLSIPKNHSMASLNLRLGSSSPEEGIDNGRNETESSKDLPNQTTSNSFDRYADFNEEYSSSNGIDFHDDSSNSHLKTWLTALIQINSLISQATDAFTYIPNDAVLEEVLESKEGSNYIKNIVEIYRVYKRIKISHQMYVECNPKVFTTNNEENLQINQTEDKIEQAWKQLIINLNGKSIIPEKALYDFSKELSKEVEHNKFRQTTDNNCGICLLNISSNHQKFSNHGNPEQNGKLIDSVLNHGNRLYHSTCANFWVNRIDLALPKLSETV